MEKLFGVLAGIGCIIAGIYLITSNSASADTTVFDVLMHGIGAYIICRGVWMIATVGSVIRSN